MLTNAGLTLYGLRVPQFGGQDGFCNVAALLHRPMDVIDGYFESATLSVRIHKLWLQGALIPEQTRRSRIPECQNRTPRAGFTTRIAEL